MSNIAGGNGVDKSESIVIDSAGRIIVAGESDNASGNSDIVVARFLTSGSLDTTFAAGTGVFVFNSNLADASSNDRAREVAIDNAGRIVVTGQSDIGGLTGWDAVVLRLTDGGVLDSTFGASGVAYYHASTGGWNDDLISGIVILPTGEMIAAGSSDDGTPFYRATVWKILSDGGLDATFGTAGVFRHSELDAGAMVKRVALDSAGRILFSGYACWAGSSCSAVLWRITAAGALDTTFNDAGFVSWGRTTGTDGGAAYFTGLTIDSAGRIVVSGYGWNGTTRDVAVLRYFADGGLDPTFGTNGVTFHHSAAGGNDLDEGWAHAVDALGRIVVVGRSKGSAANEYDMAIWRFNP